MVHIWRAVRAPFTLVSLAIGGILMFLFLAAISVGGWYEKLLLRLGTNTPGWIPASLGVVTFLLVGMVVPAVILGQLIGWPGAVLGPTIMVILVSRLNHW